MAGYSDKEREQHVKYMKDNPYSPYWTTERGERIPFELLNDDHLNNIINHLKRRKANYKINGIPPERTQETINTMEDIKKRRLIAKTTAGKVLYGGK